MKVLVVKTSSMGDVIHTFPAVTDAAAAIPGVVMDWCVEADFADLPKLHPAIRSVHVVAARRWRKSLLAADTRAEVGEVRRKLRTESYDLVIDAQGLLKSALVARLAGAQVYGMDRKSARESFASSFYSRRFEIARDQHAVTRTRQLFAAALGYDMPAREPDFGLTTPRPTRYLPGNEDVAVLLHGASWETKKWSVQGWSDLARRLARRGIAPLVTYGSEAERKVVDAICAAEPTTILVPKSRLAEMAAVIGRSHIAIGADSGLTHLANAFGIPTIALFFSTTPGLTGPVGSRSRILEATIDCGECGQRGCARVRGIEEPPCRTTITPDDVMAAAEPFLRPPTGRPIRRS